MSDSSFPNSSSTPPRRLKALLAASLAVSIGAPGLAAGKEIVRGLAQHRSMKDLIARARQQ